MGRDSVYTDNEKTIAKCACDTIYYLLKHYPRNQNITFTIFLDNDAVTVEDAEDDVYGFGVYLPEIERAYIAGKVHNPEIVSATIAHEYKHYMQFCDEQSYDEDEAESFAQQVLKQIEKEKEKENENY